MHTKNALSTKAIPETPIEMVCLQTDDTAYYENETFFELEIVTRKLFATKEAQHLTSTHTIKFNSCIV